MEVAAADAARHRRRELPGVKDDLVPQSPNSTGDQPENGAHGLRDEPHVEPMGAGGDQDIRNGEQGLIQF